MFAELMEMFRGNAVEIPILQPIIDALMGIPLVNFVVSFLLWKPLFAILFAPGLAALMVAMLFIIWFERKVTARVQWRYGPLEISRSLGGLIQPLADGMRYLFQEVIVHREAHKPLFIQLPLLSFIPVLLPFLFIPAGTIYAIRTPYALPLIVALISLVPMLIVLIGWASNSKYAYLGSMREVFMYFGYEVALIVVVMAMVLMYGSADLIEIVEKQKSLPGILFNPIACIAFFMVTAMATSRFPFEIPEADQEVVFGPFIEYTGIMFGIVMTLGYEKLYLLSLLFSILFLGGWNGPTIAILGDLSPALWLFLKTVVLMMMFVFLRTVYPRFRLDQAIKFGWTTLLSLSVISLAVAAVIRLVGWL